MPRKRKYDYFAAFVQQMEYAVQEADLLIEVVNNFEGSEGVKKYLPFAHDIEHKADEINHLTYAALAADFITPIDREDIMAVAVALDDIVDDIEEAIRLFYILNVNHMHHDVVKVVALVRQSCEALQVALTEFVSRKTKKKFHQAIKDVSMYEEQADDLHEVLITRLYREDADNPMRVMKWTQVFGKVEDAADDCEHVADLLESIAITSS